MAKKQGLQDTSKMITSSFTKGLNKDSDPSFVSEGMWTHAINAVNNSIEGDIGTLSNEISNFLCGVTGATMPVTATKKYIIGAVYLYSDKWIVFTAGHASNGKRITSEIGLLEEDVCRYRPIVQSKCLNFDKRYLISGASREKEDCSWQVYWSDGFNPDRYLNVGDPKTWPTLDYAWVGGGALTMNYYSNGVNTEFLWPGVAWVEKEILVNDCEFVVLKNTLVCDNTRLARLITTPCLNLTLGQSGGTLSNGTYFATIAYTIKGQKVTDYFSQSNNQFIFSVNDLDGSLILEINADTVNFDEFVLVIVQNINQGTVANQFGFYPTTTTRISIDQINPSLVKVPLEQLPLVTPVFETSDQMADVNDYLLRVGPRSKFDFNYQPLANLIQTRWASVQYPADYYMKGGNKTNYLRDEVYTFYIRWVYNTGDKSASYHIPGRAPRDFNVPNLGVRFETENINDKDALATDDRVFEIYNTASRDSSNLSFLPGATFNTTLNKWVLDDGGVVLATGDMGYWESTENYPNDRPDIWDPSYYCWTGPEAQTPTGQTEGPFDLCGKKIRHHKFPENFIANNSTTDAVHFQPNTSPATISSTLNIRLMTAVFDNITLPKDQDGVDIPGIAGYEILRGSREGNKTIVAKGMVNNFRTYQPRGAVAQNKIGLYPNYPFNTIIPIGSSSTSSDHNYLYNDPYIFNQDKNKNSINQNIPTDIFTFHSPDTMFRTPYLNTTEFKLYGTLNGYSNTNFQEPSDHPKWKLLASGVVAAMIIGGIAEAIISLIGKRTINQPQAMGGSGASDSPGVSGATSLAGAALLAGAAASYNTFISTYWTGFGPLLDAGLSVTGGYSATSVANADQLYAQAGNVAAGLGSNVPIVINGTVEFPKWAYLDPITRSLGALNQIAFYFSEGADVTLQIFYALTPYRQYAMQCLSYGFYSNMTTIPTSELKRFKMDEGFYLRDNLQDVPRYQDVVSGAYNSYMINNLKRSDAVTIRTKSGPYYNPAYASGVNIGPNLITSGFADKSLVTVGTIVQNSSDPAFISSDLPAFNEDDKNIPFSLPIASHYGAIKARVRNQYGQLGSEFQVVVTPCEQKLSNYTVAVTNYTCPKDNKEYIISKIVRTPIIFGGDTYINRYTEKNNMIFYYDWLYGQPDGFEYNYYLRSMIPQARFAVNSIRYDAGFLSELINFTSPSVPGTGGLPSAFYNMDYYVSSSRFYNYATDVEEGNFLGDKYEGLWSVRNAYFYLANSGIRDFFVESDVIVDFRKQSTREGGKHYDPYRYTDYIAMFDMNPGVMGKLSEYIYDYSLSVSKLYSQYFSAGNVQSKYYNPNVAKLCYTYYPDRIIYSLPQQFEAIKDSWFIYLVNNYKEFKGQISGVKAINKSGLFITFKNESPQMYQGVDTLETDLNTKITIGDGGLFSQPQQAVSNADKAYEYGSSQNRLSVISTPVGIYYMSQNQGRVFSYSGGLQEISAAGMKWWYILYMPYRLTEDFPDYPWQDNPVAGIGCQATYDSSSTVLYFCKKDYYLKDEFKGRVVYRPMDSEGIGDDFILDDNQNLKYNLGDPYLFEDSSWTISYDPKQQFWISFHDWHPDLVIPTKDIFLSTKENTFWKHNYVCNSFCNYYNQQYGWEIEFPIVSGQTVMTTRSVEYALECYRRNAGSCIDQHHVLDYNFDQAVVYNTEQVSGYLNLNLYPKNDINLSLQFPKLNGNLASYDILFSKEEQKYRFNQFWDITKNRDEFPIGSNYPPTGPVIPGTTILQGNYSSENTWVTAQNGYTRVLNPLNMDYDKPELQRKKFRHYLNFLNLRREQCNDVNMILKFSNLKNQYSAR
jgi:hypothetical protein